MSANRTKKRIATLGLVLMLLALFAYVASLDDSDPEALPETVERVDEGAP